ncbi:hypothetical protein TMatcc_005514 [Talaromyces marneffei ATCC 18224]|uniref:Cytochrome P450 alkane hydroxylase, putative n=2 Tax=Talaromyces marneffei TaxID=37727 RepID=B6QA65_TALMQ|nr:uncharacterized protein EYB26_005949 [Talaromyces marneffei]EEA26229.1 cytochrome P450 alkane hydroxylase, putative [Talaromyces marneffei ATCC 18224]KAE8554926.1 hypothetical protein EYB25_003473 [Talaromyces marneffei]QGA18265.1 hypothetical protein EYB26_005949 [Talaromyces marneffei]
MIGELLSNISPSRTALWLVLSLFILFWFLKLRVARQIHLLGGKSPIIPTYLPCAVDFIFGSARAAKRNQDLVFLKQSMVRAQQHNKLDFVPFTVEINQMISNRVIITIDPENIKAILTGQFHDFGKGESFHQEWREFLGDSIFATDGELWFTSRQLLRPMFNKDRIVDTQIFETHVQKLIQLFGGSKNANGSKIVDVGDLYFRFTLDAATGYLLGQGTDSLENPKTRFAEAFRYVQSQQSIFFRMGPLSPFLSRKKFREELQVMENFIQPYIQTVLSLSVEESEKILSKRETFLDALARFTRDPRVLRDQLVAVLLAGRDTTAGTLSFCTFELSRHPEVVAKLRQEIAERVGVGAAAKIPTYADLKEMKYLNAVINESLRFYPVVPFNVRYSLTDTTLPHGGGPDGKSPIGVRADTRIVYSTLLMQREETFYDQSKADKYYDPGQWIPERWTSGWQPKPWQFIPFNGGPRICLGQQFAMLEMLYTITRILQVYEKIVAVPVSGHDKVEDPVLRFEVTLSPGTEMNCVFVRDGEGQV